MIERSRVIAKRALWSAAGAGACALIYAVLSVLSLGKYARSLEQFGGYMLIAGMIVGCFAAFNCLVWISMQLRGPARVAFNVLGAFTVPLCLSLFFVKGGIVRTASGVVGDIPSLWFLIPLIATVVLVSLIAREFDREHPIGGFAMISIVAWIFYVAVFYALLIVIVADDVGRNRHKFETLHVDVLRQYLLLVCFAYLTVGVRLWFDRRAVDGASSE